jgi:RimJ/RimL family protein N-acetyltransferase
MSGSGRLAPQCKRKQRRVEMADIIRQQRLRLRPIASSDARSLERLLLGDAEAIAMTERLPDPCTQAAALAWIERRQGPGQHVFALETIEIGEFIGCIGFVQTGDTAGLGYWIGRPYWNQGYATEAGRAVLDDARGLGVRTVLAETFLDNPASARVLSKLGFAPAGRVDKDLPQRGGQRRLLQFQRAL